MLGFRVFRIWDWGPRISGQGLWMHLQDLPGLSNVVPFWVWYGFLGRTLIRTTKKGTTWEGLGRA